MQVYVSRIDPFSAPATKDEDYFRVDVEFVDDQQAKPQSRASVIMFLKKDELTLSTIDKKAVHEAKLFLSRLLSDHQT